MTVLPFWGDLLDRDLPAVNAQARPLRDPVGPRRSTTKALQAVLQSIRGDSLKDARDRALFALRIAGAFRAAELASLSFDQLNFEEQSVEVHLRGWGSRRSGRRSMLVIPNDDVVRPVSLLAGWVAESGLRQGRVFRQIAGARLGEAPLTTQHIVRIIQSRASAAGCDGDVLQAIREGRASFICHGQSQPVAPGGIAS